MEDLERTVHEVVLEVARRRKPDLEGLEPDQRLTVDLGLKSLDVAQVVAVLEDRLEMDPFSELVAITSIRTVGDLAAAYRRCQEGAAADGRAAVDEGSDRAQARAAATGRSRRDARRALRETPEGGR